MEAALLATVRAADALTTWASLAQGRALTELREVCLWRQDLAHDPEAPRAVQRAAEDPDGWVRSLAGWHLGMSERQVRERLEFAESMRRFQALAELVEQARTPFWTAMRTAHYLEELATLVTPDELDRQESAVVRWLGSAPRTPGALHRRMERILAVARDNASPDPDTDCGPTPPTDGPSPLGPDTPPSPPPIPGVFARHLAREVSVYGNGDGTATLWARLPESDGLAIAAALDAATPVPRPDDEARTRDQRRADVLVAAITGAPAAYGRDTDVPADRAGAGGSRGCVPRFQVLMPVSALLGLSHQAVEGPGSHGVISATTLRDLAGEPGATWSGLLYDAATGTLRGLAPDLPALLAAITDGPLPTRAATGNRRRLLTWSEDLPAGTAYAHPPRVEAMIKARDYRCRAPNCARRARVCDCDHVVGWPDGETSLANGCSLCRYHHRLKTHAPGWSTRMDHQGSLVWTDPTGATHWTQPHDYRDDDIRQAAASHAAGGPDDPPPWERTA